MGSPDTTPEKQLKALKKFSDIDLPEPDRLDLGPLEQLVQILRCLRSHGLSPKALQMLYESPAARLELLTDLHSMLLREFLAEKSQAVAEFLESHEFGWRDDGRGSETVGGVGYTLSALEWTPKSGGQKIIVKIGSGENPMLHNKIRFMEAGLVFTMPCNVGIPCLSQDMRIVVRRDCWLLPSTAAPAYAPHLDIRAYYKLMGDAAIECFSGSIISDSWPPFFVDPEWPVLPYADLAYASAHS